MYLHLQGEVSRRDAGRTDPLGANGQVCLFTLWIEEIPMRNPSATARKAILALSVPVSVIVAAAMVWHSSYAAFSSTTRASGNSWSTGSVVLSNDSAGSARFQVNNMLPGQTGTACITVTANATNAGIVKGYAVNTVPSPQGIENYIFFTVNEGTGGSFASCSGFTSASTVVNNVSMANVFQATNYATGFGGWSITPGVQTRVYQISWTFNTTGLTQTQLDAMQGARAGMDLQWELQTS